MANNQYLKLLKSGVRIWNEWMDKSPSIWPNLVKADMVKDNISEANLGRTDLIGADLIGANLCGANLTRADLSGADLTRADLSGANLSGADLSRANLSEADLSDADLSGATLNRTTLIQSDLSRANLSRANLNGANLSRAYLSGANLSRANLSEANFMNSVIGFTAFGLTNLSTCKGLETVNVNFDCIIDFQTLRSSKNIPKSFLLKIGLPELFIDYLPDFYMDSITFYPAFLSHSSLNKPFARKLYEALIAKGVNVFIDEKKMKPGDDIYESLSKGISYYDKMILVCSKESLTESWWVDRELDRVLAKERQLKKERGERINLLIPITIDKHIFSWDGAKAEEVRRYIIGDFTEWEDDTKFEKALNDLIHALNVNRPDIKPPSFL